MPDANPSQWPETNNFSVHVAGEMTSRFEHISNLVRGIQRWWRWRKEVEKGASNEIPMGVDRLAPWHLRTRKRLITLRDIANTVREPLLTQNEVIGTEKLDGTNFGINCQGLIVGRRQVVTGDTYQKVSFAGEIPTHASVLEARGRICGRVPPLEGGLETLYLYGELIPSGAKQKEFSYESRGLMGKWLCFGASLTLREATDPDPISASLQEAGFWHSVGQGRITLAYSTALVELLEGIQGVTMVPSLGEGRLIDIVMNNRETMLDNDRLEGIVFNSNGWRSKWKTGKEDVSQGEALLKKAKELVPFIGLRGGINVPIGYTLGGAFEGGVEPEGIGECWKFLNVLIEVVTNRPVLKAAKSKGDKMPKKAKEDPIPPAELEEKIESARTKFNSITSFFEDTPVPEGAAAGSAGRTEIMQLLMNEVTEDTGAENDSDKKVQIKRAIGKKVGEEFSRWSRARAGS